MLFVSIVVGYCLGGLFGIGVGMTVANVAELLLVVCFIGHASVTPFHVRL